MEYQKNAPSNTENGFGVSTQKPSAEIVPSSPQVEAFEHVQGDTINDVSDMKRMGKKQEFRVREPPSSRSLYQTKF